MKGHAVEIFCSWCRPPGAPNTDLAWNHPKSACFTPASHPIHPAVPGLDVTYPLPPCVNQACAQMMMWLLLPTGLFQDKVTELRQTHICMFTFMMWSAGLMGKDLPGGSPRGIVHKKIQTAAALLQSHLPQLSWRPYQVDIARWMTPGAPPMPPWALPAG